MAVATPAMTREWVADEREAAAAAHQWMANKAKRTLQGYIKRIAKGRRWVQRSGDGESIFISVRFPFRAIEFL